MSGINFLDKNGYPLTLADARKVEQEILRSGATGYNRDASLGYLRAEMAKFPTEESYRREMAKRWSVQTALAMGIDPSVRTKQYQDLLKFSERKMLSGASTEAILGGKTGLLSVVSKAHSLGILRDAGSAGGRTGHGRSYSIRVNGQVLSQQNAINYLRNKPGMPDFSNMATKAGRARDLYSFIPSFLGAAASRSQAGFLLSTIFGGLYTKSGSRRLPRATIQQPTTQG